jgi:hypothetical protein
MTGQPLHWPLTLFKKRLSALFFLARLVTFRGGALYSFLELPAAVWVRVPAAELLALQAPFALPAAAGTPVAAPVPAAAGAAPSPGGQDVPAFAAAAWSHHGMCYF